MSMIRESDVQNQFAVVIPTRNRADTLIYTLKTCIEQKYSNENYIVVVCDNNSSDNTKEIVESYHSDKIHYIHTGRSLPMHESWEFALKYTLSVLKTGYIIYVGDDDGLLEESLIIANDLINKYNVDAICCSQPQYWWPINLDDKEIISELTFKLSNWIYFEQSKPLLNKLARSKGWYNRLPCIYHSFVNVDIINRILSVTKNIFFQGVCPDVYSSIIIAAYCPSYLYVEYPLRIAGISSKSNGFATFDAQIKESDTVRCEFSELNSTSQLATEISSIQYVVYESMVLANENLKLNLSISHNKWLKLILDDLSSKTPQLYTKSMSALYTCRSLQPYLPPREDTVTKYSGLYNQNKQLLGLKGMWITLKNKNFKNIYDASQWISVVFSNTKPQYINHKFMIRIPDLYLQGLHSNMINLRGVLNYLHKNEYKVKTLK